MWENNLYWSLLPRVQLPLHKQFFWGDSFRNHLCRSFPKANIILKRLKRPFSFHSHVQQLLQHPTNQIYQSHSLLVYFMSFGSISITKEAFLSFKCFLLITYIRTFGNPVKFYDHPIRYDAMNFAEKYKIGKTLLIP